MGPISNGYLNIQNQKFQIRFTDGPILPVASIYLLLAQRLLRGIDRKVPEKANLQSTASNSS